MTTQPLSDLEKWLLLTTRVHTGRVTQADVAYVVGETPDNAPSALAKATELHLARIVPHVSIQQGGEGHGYIGYENSRSSLLASGLTPQDIVPMQFDLPFEAVGQVNTMTELISLARLARRVGWERIALVVPSFHRLRTFLTAITAFDEEAPGTKLYTVAGKPLLWDEIAVHSQGTLQGTRADILVAEVRRIKTYQENGKPYPLVSVDRALEYLAWRGEDAI